MAVKKIWCPSSRRSGRRKFTFTLRSASLLLLSRLTDCMEPAHIREDNLLTQAIHSNVDLIQNHPGRHPQNNVWPKSGHLVAQSIWHIKLTTTKNLCNKNNMKHKLVEFEESWEKSWKLESMVKLLWSYFSFTLTSFVFLFQHSL